MNISTITDGSICSPMGFKASGICAGLKQSNSPDMALLYSEVPAVTAGLLTSNIVTAAPVQYCKKILNSNDYTQAIIINSGNANACTGKSGYADTCKMATKTAEMLKIEDRNILVASTGRIGVPLPMNIIIPGIENAVKNLTSNGGHEAAKAIMTTDTYSKEIAVNFIINDRKITIGGMAKGAGMIAPNLKELHATMLAFITTDASISHSFLKAVLKNSTDNSFNCITVDGDMSTNDSLFAMANGLAGNELLTEDNKNSKIFYNALEMVMCFLAKSIVRDGEGVTKLVNLKVINTKNKNDAILCARAIANSLLCKTAWFGNDPNWGRIAAAAGYSGAIFNPDKLNIYYDSIPVLLNGMDSKIPEMKISKILKQSEFSLVIDLSSGKESHSLWTNDISYKYVEINADYHT